MLHYRLSDYCNFSYVTLLLLLFLTFLFLSYIFIALKTINNSLLLLPTQIGRYFEDSSTQEITHSHNLRSRNSNAPPRFISEKFTGEKSIQYKGAQIWNSLPTEIQSCESLNIFKKSYKNFLIDNSVESE